MRNDKKFTRGNGEIVSYKEMIEIICNYICKDINAEYEITVGTDSQNHSDTKMVEVIALHSVGNGGIFFYNAEHIKRISSIRDKIVEETNRSLANANGLLEEIQLNLIDKDIDIEGLNLHLQIHCDIGDKGKSKSLMTQITNWVNQMGYDCLIKPNSYTASGIANKISK